MIVRGAQDHSGVTLSVLAQTIAILAAVILIPLLPAFVLYRLLPSKAQVTGPLQGLRLDLSGAFAGYFALVVFALVIVTTVEPERDTAPRYEEHALAGTFTLDDPPDDVDTRFFDIALHPEKTEIVGPVDFGKYSWRTMIPLKRDHTGVLVLPELDVVINYPGYFTAKAPLHSGTVQAERGIIRFEDMQMIPVPQANEEPREEVELR